jgi:hypothetical protein
MNKMKYLLFLLILGIIATFNTACSETEPKDPIPFSSVADYKAVPQLIKGNYWVYILQELNAQGNTIKSYTDSIWVISDTVENGVHYSVVRSSLSGSFKTYQDSAGILRNDLKEVLFAPKRGLLGNESCYSLSVADTLTTTNFPVGKLAAAVVIYTRSSNCPIPLDIERKKYFYSNKIGLIGYEDYKDGKVFFESKLLRYKVKL